MTLTAQEASDLFRRPPDRHVAVDHGEVAVRSVGSGPDVLFVHGWPASGATFRGLLPYLVPSVRCHLLDLPGAGSSRFDDHSRLGIADHAHTVRQVVTALHLDDVAVVGHDSGGLVARHAVAGDPRVRSWGLIDTEQPQGPSLRFRAFLASRRAPRFDLLLRQLVSRPRLRRLRLALGDCFEDRDLLDGEFDEFFLRPLRDEPARLRAATRFAHAFDLATFAELGRLHREIEVPVALAYGARDPFFPLAWAQDMVGSFSGPTQLHAVERGRLFSHEEFPEEVARALLPTLVA